MTVLDPLASADDVAALLGILSEGLDDDQVAAMLAQASARFRAEAQCDFTETDTTLILRVVGGRVDLPKRPVLEVSAVASVGTDGTESDAIAGWTFDGIHTIRVGDQSWVINATAYQTETVSVTWSHGFTDVPEDVRWAVAQMTARAISSPAPAPGVSGETIGAYSYRTGGTGESGAQGMTADERAIAHRYRPLLASHSSVVL
jgi:hypothetical protein